MLKTLFAASILKKLLRFTGWVFGGIVVLLIVLSLIILIPSVQTMLVNKVGDTLSKKTGMPVKVGSVHIAFPKTIRINEIFIQDLQADTLLFTDALKVDVALLPLLRKRISVSYLQISGFRSTVYRDQGDTLFNYSPLIAAFYNPEKTNKKPKPLDWNISLEELEFNDFRVSYQDHVDSMFMNLHLGLLSLEAKKIDVQNLTFDLEKAALLNTSFSMRMQSSQKVSEQGTSAKANLPFHISVDEISLDNISYDLQIGKDTLSLKASVYHADATPELIDLPGEKIQMREFNIEGVDVALNIKSSPEEVEITQEDFLTDFTFGNFGWDFLVDYASIKNTSFVMDIGEKSDAIVGMDYSHMAFSNFSAKADSIFFNKNTTGAVLRSMSAREKSGPQLLDMKGRFFMDNQGIHASNVVMQTPGSFVEGSASLGYSALRNIGSEISRLEIKSNLRGNVSAREILPFAPIIAEVPFMNKIDGLQNIRVQTSGPLGNMLIHEASFSIGNEGFFLGQCAVKGLPSLDLDVKFQIDSVYLSGKGFREWAPDSLLPDGINLPSNIFFKASGETNLINGDLIASMNTDLGNASLEVHKADSIVTASFVLDSLNVGHIIGQPMLGKISMSTDASIQMSGFTPTAFTSKTAVSHIGINNYPLKYLLVDLAFHENKYNLGIHAEDPALLANLSAAISMKDSAVEMTADLNLTEANLLLLGFMTEPFTLASDMTLALNYKSIEISSMKTLMQNVAMTNKNGSYLIDTVSLRVEQDENVSNFSLHSDVVDASLFGNTKISELGVAVIDQIDRHIAMPDSMLNPKSFEFELNVDWKKPDFLAGFLFEDLQELELSRFHAHYNDEQNILSASIDMPRVKYSNLAFDTISFHIDSHRDSSVASLKIFNVSIDSASLRNISIESAFSTENMKLRFETHDPYDNLKYRLYSTATINDSAVTLSINPESLVLNYLPWSLPSGNMLHFDKNTIIARQAVMTNGTQKISIITENDNLKLQLENFRIRNIIGLLEGDTTVRPMQGMIDGYVAIGKWPENSRVDALLDVHDFKIQNKYIGTIHTEVSSSDQITEFSVLVKNDINSIEANGYLTNKEDDKSISIITEYDIDDASSFQPFLEEYITDLKGKINGRLSVSGSLNAPLIFGNIACEDLGGTIPAIHSAWTTTGDIAIVRNRFQTDSFFLKDAQGNKLTLSGSIDGAELTRPFFDIKLQTDNFFVVDNPVQAENTLSGKLAMGIDIQAKGYFSDMALLANLKINKETDAVYTLPGKELELITDKGVVAFVDFDKPLTDTLAIETFSLQDSITDLLQGIDLTADLTVDPAARFTVIIDPNSGDFTKFNVGGKLHYVFNKNIRGQLTGLIEFKEGFYELSFYGLVKKRFDFVPGSTVNWDGDIMDGDLNFSARYTVKTNSVGLVSNQISSYEKALYNQRLPYDVILNVKDKISSPSVSFALDLQQSYRSAYPTLDTKLNILNQPSMESERNKQVFALLVGGTFIPENPDISEGSSSQSFATTAAINSVNAIMTQQLNNLTGQFIKHFDLDMGVNTFDDYSTGTAQTKTQLDVKVSKNMFNDRVSAEVESHINLDGSNNTKGTQSNAGQTEFAVSYKLTPTGNYRIKAFRENAYDIFDGEIQNSGIAFIFVREFDSFSKFNQKAIVPPDTTATTPESQQIEE